MRPPHFGVRSLMLAVVAVAMLIWGGMMGSRSYREYRIANLHDEDGRRWRRNSDRRSGSDPGMARFARECADYYEGLAREHRRAMWSPWKPAAADPLPPGVAEALKSRGHRDDARN